MSYDRAVQGLVVAALRDTPIVFVMGPRQAGKSTLVKLIAETDHPAEIFTFDTLTVREQAQNDPTGFLIDRPGNLVIDEVQRVPDLILEIKADVDNDRRPGRFLLTGSSNPLRSRKMTESLAGRVEFIVLWPLSQAEIEGVRIDLVDQMMRGDAPSVSNAPEGRAAWVERAVRGGFPEAVERNAAARRRWFDNYIAATLDSDIRDVADIYKRAELPRLLSRLAANSGQIVSWSRAGSDLGLADKTVVAYTELLSSVFLVQTLPAWRPRIAQRVVSAPKVLVSDAGLLCHLLGVDAARLQKDDRLAGVVMESFVASEVNKLVSISETRPRIHHFRDRDGHEVDLVLEARNGDVVGIEAKAGVSIRGGDLRGLRSLRGRCGDRFKAGAIIHAGKQTMRLDDRIWAVPVSALWS